MLRARAKAKYSASSFTAASITLAVFLALLAVLATRLATGHDPRLSEMTAKHLPPARHVLVKRIYERVVIVHLPADAPKQTLSSSQQTSSEGGAFSAGAPVTRTS